MMYGSDRNCYRGTDNPEAFLNQIFGQELAGLEQGLKLQLLATPQRELEKAYAKLRKMGIPEEKIASAPMLLARDPALLKKNHTALARKGFCPQEIADIAEILCLNPNLIKNRAFLEKLRHMVDKNKGKQSECNELPLPGSFGLNRPGGKPNARPAKRLIVKPDFRKSSLD